MTIPVSAITQYEGNEWETYLDKICLYEIFKDLISEFGHDKELVTSLIRYIVWSYSVESDKIVYGMEWLKNKNEIYKICGLANRVNNIYEDEETKTTYHEGIVLLKYRPILHTIKKWLNFQDDETFATRQMLSDLIVEMRLAANSPIIKSTGEIDYEAKRKCAETVIDLIEKKADIEQKFIQNNPRLKDAYSEINKASKKDGRGFGLESILKEKNGK